MNSNLKLLPAALFVAVLALAGCGGGSSDDTMTPPPPPPPTPEEQCLAGDGVVYEDGVCKTAEDLRNEGRDAEKEAEAAKAAQALAKKLRGLLMPATVVASNAQTTDTESAALLTKARSDGMAASANGNTVVAIMNTQGAGNQVNSIHTDGTTRPVASAVLTLATNARHVMGSGFATGTNQVLDHTDLVGEGARTVTGSYMGAMGVYTCPTATDCTSQRTDSGIQLTSASGGWTFTPNTGQKFTTPDTAYAEYGWWINEDAANDPKAGAWFADPAGAALGTIDVSAATGSATYTGTAIGQATYYHSQGGGLNVGGAFTADAELKATFGATSTLTGTIDNFDVGGMKPGWSVALSGGSIANGTGTVATAATTTTTWTIDGTKGAALASGWSAQLYDIPTGAHQPTGVAGGFRAEYESDGYMVGAFGAEQ